MLQGQERRERADVCAGAEVRETGRRTSEGGEEEEGEKEMQEEEKEEKVVWMTLEGESSQ